MKVLGGILGVVIAATLLWIGGEFHYRNCVNAAEKEVENLPQPDRALADARGTLSERVEGCSRVPF